MKRLTIFIVLLVLCLLLAIWSPWTSLRFNLGAFFGIKQASEVSGLQVNSLSGTVSILLDGEEIGSVTAGGDAFIADNISPGEHLVTLNKEVDVENAYWTFSKVINFYKGTTVVASFNLGPDEDFSEGHLIYASENVNYENKNNLIINLNIPNAVLTIDSDTERTFQGTTLNTALSLDRQHTILIHKEGYESLQFTILPSAQEDRDKLNGLNLNIDAHLLLQPIELEIK